MLPQLCCAVFTGEEVLQEGSQEEGSLQEESREEACLVDASASSKNGMNTFPLGTY